MAARQRERICIGVAGRGRRFWIGLRNQDGETGHRRLYDAASGAAAVRAIDSIAYLMAKGHKLADSSKTQQCYNRLLGIARDYQDVMI